MGEDLRHRYTEAIVASLGQTGARPTLATEVVAAAGSMATAAFAAADAVLAVRDEELERLRHTSNTDSRINAQLREEITRLRISAEKDVCSGCMQREEARDRAMESARQTGVKYEGAKQRWYEQQDRAEDAEERLALARDALLRDGYFKPDQVGPDVAPRITERLSALRHELEQWHAAYGESALPGTLARLRKAEGVVAAVDALHRVHRCEDGHVLDRTPTPCVNDGVCSCGQPAERCRERAILDSQESPTVAEAPAREEETDAGQ